jgi:hypothetical protein
VPFILVRSFQPTQYFLHGPPIIEFLLFILQHEHRRDNFGLVGIFGIFMSVGRCPKITQIIVVAKIEGRGDVGIVVI